MTECLTIFLEQDYFAFDGSYPESTCSVQGGAPSPAPTPSPTGYDFVIGPTQCYKCLAGSFSSDAGSGTCSPCLSGYYQDANQSTFCKPCPTGKA